MSDLEKFRQRLKRFQIGTLAEAHRDMDWLLREHDALRSKASALLAACPKNLEEAQEMRRALE